MLVVQGHGGCENATAVGFLPENPVRRGAASPPAFRFGAPARDAPAAYTALRCLSVLGTVSVPRERKTKVKKEEAK